MLRWHKTERTFEEKRVLKLYRACETIKLRKNRTNVLEKYCITKQNDLLYKHKLWKNNPKKSKGVNTMEIKINLNINIDNFNELIEKLSQLSNKTTIPSRTGDFDNTEIIQSIKPKENTSFNKDIDLTKLRESIATITRNGNILAVQNLLKKYNAKTLVEVNKEDYNSLYNEISKLIN